MARSLLFVLLFLLSRPDALRAQAIGAAPDLDATAHRQSVLAFQQALNKEFLDPAESPLTAAERGTFKSLPYFPTDSRFYVQATLVRDSTSLPFAMPTSTAPAPALPQIRRAALHAARPAPAPERVPEQELMQRAGFEDYLFVPFTDLTNGHGSYGGGRYLDLRMPPAGTAHHAARFQPRLQPVLRLQPRLLLPRATCRKPAGQ